VLRTASEPLEKREKPDGLKAEYPLERNSRQIIDIKRK
jgi:hypothetical protein